MVISLLKQVVNTPLKVILRGFFILSIILISVLMIFCHIHKSNTAFQPFQKPGKAHKNIFFSFAILSSNLFVATKFIYSVKNAIAIAVEFCTWLTSDWIRTATVATRRNEHLFANACLWNCGVACTWTRCWVLEVVRVQAWRASTCASC